MYLVEKISNRQYGSGTDDTTTALKAWLEKKGIDIGSVSMDESD